MVEVVDDVDAADEGHLPVDHRQLAVQPAQVAPGQPEAAQLAVDAQLHAARTQALGHCGGHVAGAEAVDGDAHRDAARGGAYQRVADGAADVVVGVDVGFQHYLERGLVDRFDQRGKEVLAAVQQAHGVAAGRLAAAPCPAQHAVALYAGGVLGRVAGIVGGASGSRIRPLGVGYP
ncbi:hypothetical protein D3C72_1708330 [compost metagenome]